jgi:hypothetical protein
LESSFGLRWGIFCLLIFFFSCILSLVYRIRLLVYGLCYFSFLSVSIMIYREKISIFFIYILGSWSMFSGFLLSSFIFADSFFILTSFLKILGTLVVLIGIFIYFIFSFIYFRSFLKSFFSDIFFLSWFSGWFISRIINYWGSVNSFDLIWTELLGPKGFYYFSFIGGDLIVKIEYFSYKMIYIFVGLILSIYILKFFMCLLNRALGSLLIGS